ncbi:hypothetical protein BGZ83_006692 [Gryganskiella cystojenkinii]|nr:hypothetical protein BGZ83_006692 [Gryganskiella cystojenkinii]
MERSHHRHHLHHHGHATQESQASQGPEDLSTLDSIEQQKLQQQPFPQATQSYAFPQQQQQSQSQTQAGKQPQAPQGYATNTSSTTTGVEPDQQQQEQQQQKLKLASLVDRVREVQKTDPTQLQTPPPPPEPVVKPQEQEPEERRHWYSSFLGRHQRRNHHASSSSESSEQPLVQVVPDAKPPKELSTVDHVANAFASTSRANNLETIDFTVESLAITGAAAPAFLLQTDDRGRRPPPVFFQMLRLGIVDSEVGSGNSKQVVFRIELQYGDVKWVIRRTLYEFYKLHLTLSTKHYANLPRFPNQVSWALSMAKASLGMNTDDQDVQAKETNRARRRALQTYLLQVLQELNGTVVYDLYEFLEISALSLTKDMGWKGKEGYVDTKIVDTSRTFCGLPLFSEYEEAWAILRDSYMAFANNSSATDPSDVFIFDQSFSVQHKEQVLGYNLHHIELRNSYRKIEIKGEHNRDMLEWMEYFQKMQQSSPWVKSHRFGSFAPERNDAKVRYYVDGKDYFHAISDAILAAKSEIYIADWWLSPELYLRRPPEKNQEFRLDRLLKRKAQEGVKIYVVVYKEVSLALTLDSSHTKTWLQDLHPNIQVQRHPDHISVTATQFWAHHEKICVIDCRLAFIGGLDLCFGRYDSRTHQLADYHPSGAGTVWPGQDYSNPRIKDFANVKEYNNDLIERKLLGRMPWHDVSIGVAGQPARDIARHFVQRWNFVKREKGMKKSHMKFLMPKGEFVSTRNETGWTGSQKVQILRSSTNWSQGIELEHSIQNAYIGSIESAEHFIYIENQFFVTLAVENGHPDLVNTIGIALVNRIVRAHQEGKKFRVIVVMPLMPAFEADIMSSEAGTLRKVMHFQYVSICRGGNSVMERLEANGINPADYISFYGLRSFDRIKHGKFDAIVEAVKEAETEGTTKDAPKDAEAVAVAAAEEAGRAAAVSAAAKKGNQLNVPAAQGGELGRKKSLAAKFLLDPIPHGERAGRLKALHDKRKQQDKERTWDDSITKRAMNRSKKEHGYVPSATERTLADKRTTEDIRQSTLEAEKLARIENYRKITAAKADAAAGAAAASRIEAQHKEPVRTVEPQQSEHHTLDGLRSTFHHAVNTIKGSKDQDQHGQPKIVIMNKDGVDKLMVQKDDDSSARNKIKTAKKEDEAILEPAPLDHSIHAEVTGSSSSQAPQQQEDADNESEIVDNEVDDFVTEQLYIHSKLMIIDDRTIIIGSANLNDRSQVGFRDSEIAIIIEDSDMIPSKMNGVEYQAGRIAHALRTDLFKEHLGLLPHVEHDVVTRASVLPVDLDSPSKDPEQTRKALILAAREAAANGGSARGNWGHICVTEPDQEEAEAFQKWHAPLAQGQQKRAAAENPKTADEIVMDPLHDDFYETWWKRVANTNTMIFREVFHCVPDDTIENWDQYKAFVPDPKKILTGHVVMPGATVENVTEKLQKVTGHLVEFPTKFLKDENLMGSAVEGAVTPMEIFT